MVYMTCSLTYLLIIQDTLGLSSAQTETEIFLIKDLLFFHSRKGQAKIFWVKFFFIY